MASITLNVSQINTGDNQNIKVGTATVSLSCSGNANTATTATTASNGGVTSIVAGSNVTISPTNGLGNVTINASASGGSASMWEKDNDGYLMPVTNPTTDAFWELDAIDRYTRLQQ